MSYDLQIWSVRPVELSEEVPEYEAWESQGASWVRASRGWQIVLAPSDRVLIEDLPVEVASILPGIRYLTQLNLEPLSAPKRAHTLLRRVSNRLAKSAHGVVLDPQTDTLSTPSGVRRFRRAKREKRTALLQLSWWFNEGALLTEDGLERFVALLESRIPEAMPRRYGLYEPPQHIYAETGRGHLLDFLERHRADLVVWYPQRPVAGFHLHCEAAWGPTPRGFRSNYVQIQIEAKALEQPGWAVGLSEFWRAASGLIGPYFGDVRTLEGHIPSRAAYYADSQSEFHPVMGPWWKGIPRGPGHAIVLGEPYLALWPAFAAAAEQTGGLAFLSAGDWGSKVDLAARIGGVPEAIAQPPAPDQAGGPAGGRIIHANVGYPPEWPFEGPFLEDSAGA